MAAENQIATDILNDELPDICAGYECGADIETFKSKIKAEYERVLAEQ